MLFSSGLVIREGSFFLRLRTRKGRGGMERGKGRGREKAYRPTRAKVKRAL